MENKMEMIEREITEEILSIFKTWKDNKLAEVIVPKKIIFKETIELFLKSFYEMPFKNKMSKIMVEEIYIFYRKIELTYGKYNP
jgi:hypothetical protein